MKDVLGGKGAGLHEMTNLGVTVPPGYTLSAQLCIEYIKTQSHPRGLEEEVALNLERLEELMGRKLGQPPRPLLVSVRSGAAVSMPGMMDTILNLGLNDEAAEGLASRTGNARFAFDSYRRLIQMFGEVVEGIDAHSFESALAELKRSRGVQQDTDLTADDLRQLVATYRELYRDRSGSDFPPNAREQLLRAVRAVFASWDNPRAQVYRRAHNIPDDIGTAVNVV